MLPNVPDTAKKITNLPDVPTTDPTAITNGSTSDTVKNSNPKQRKLAAA